jgi:hypothetical protein
MPTDAEPKRQRTVGGLQELGLLFAAAPSNTSMQVVDDMTAMMAEVCRYCATRKLMLQQKTCGLLTKNTQFRQWSKQS